MESPFKITGKTNKDPTCESKFTGMYLSQETHGYLALYALYQRTAKSKIMRQEMDQWVRTAKVSHPISKLVAGLASRAQQEWNTRKSNQNDVLREQQETVFQLYIAEITTDLYKRGISVNDIEEIIKQLQV